MRCVKLTLCTKDAGPWQELLEQINGISFQDATGTNPEHAITKTCEN
jgi:hypothetical protein